MTSDLKDVIKLPVPCPHCGKEGMETVAWLIKHDETVCSYCARMIDLRSDEWHAYVNEFAEALSHVRSAYEKLF